MYFHVAGGTVSPAPILEPTGTPARRKDATRVQVPNPFLPFFSNHERQEEQHRDQPEPGVEETPDARAIPLHGPVDTDHGHRNGEQQPRVRDEIHRIGGSRR